MGFRTETGMKTGTEGSKAYFRIKSSILPEEASFFSLTEAWAYSIFSP
jgi:hypothetical protein